jgi:hypothetical protein
MFDEKGERTVVRDLFPSIDLMPFVMSCSVDGNISLQADHLDFELRDLKREKILIFDLLQKSTRHCLATQAANVERSQGFY